MSDKPASPDEPSPIKALRAVDKALSALEAVLLAVLLVALIFMAVYQAYKRNFAPPSPFWPDELIRYAVFSIGLLGAALASSTDRLINIDMFTRMMSPRGKLITRIVTTLFTITICWLVVKGGLDVREINIRLGEEGEVIKPEDGILALPVGAALIGFHLSLHTIINVWYLVTGRTPPESGPQVA